MNLSPWDYYLPRNGSQVCTRSACGAAPALHVVGFRNSNTHPQSSCLPAIPANGASDDSLAVVSKAVLHLLTCFLSWNRLSWNRNTSCGQTRQKRSA
jgi:hypothetical protein